MHRQLLAAVGLLAAAAALAVAPTATGHAQKTVKFKAALNVGQEVPHPKGTKAGASGLLKATLTGTTLKWTLTFTHLTGPALQAHIHLGVRGKSGNVVVPLCAPCHSPTSGSATVSGTVIAALKAGKTYTNVHTKKNPNGEIRGQITIAA
jgi:CHRD domain